MFGHLGSSTQHPHAPLPYGSIFGVQKASPHHVVSLQGSSELVENWGHEGWFQPVRSNSTSLSSRTLNKMD